MSSITLLRNILPLIGAFFILIHDPEGNEVFVNAEQVDFIGPPVAGSPNAKSRYMVYGIWQFAAETPREIKAKINKVLKQEEED